MKKFYILLTILMFFPALYSQAQEVDLLWQAETYAPPFYKGRGLWSNQSRIHFMAIPQGLGDPAKLDYKWIKNGTVLGNISGIGKNYIFFSDSVLSRPQNVKIEITRPSIALGGYEEYEVLASASVILAPMSPTLLVYENNPLYGFMFHREISGTHELEEKEITFSAFPLFFSATSRADSAISYQWRTNVGEAETRNSVTYRTPDDASGSSEVRVRASSKSKIMQDANRSFLIQFGI